MELLTILVIIGIVLVIAIPSVSKLTHNSDIKKLDNLISMTLEASDVYVDNYKKSFTENYDRYNFKYQTLLDNNLLKEEDIHCSGTIQATRKKGNNYTYNAYLMCKDKNGKEIYNNESELPDGGISIYGKFIMEYNVKLNDASGAKYNFDFTKENLYNEFVAYDLERPGTSAGISKFEYSFNGNDWTETIADSNSGVGSFTLTNTYNGKIYFRAYDLSGNSSETVEYTVKVDKEKPTGTITVARNGGSYNSLNAKATLSSTDNTDGSGVKQMCVQESSDITKCSWVSYATSKNLTLSGTLNGATRTVYAWYKDGVGNISDIKSATYTPYTECSQVNIAPNCSKTCGGGIKAATDKYTGKACPSKNVACNTQSCERPDDYTWSKNIACDVNKLKEVINNGKFKNYIEYQQFRNALYDCREVSESAMNSTAIAAMRSSSRYQLISTTGKSKTASCKETESTNCSRSKYKDPWYYAADYVNTAYNGKVFVISTSSDASFPSGFSSTPNDDKDCDDVYAYCEWYNKSGTKERYNEFWIFFAPPGGNKLIVGASRVWDKRKDGYGIDVRTFFPSLGAVTVRTSDEHVYTRDGDWRYSKYSTYYSGGRVYIQIFKI